LGSTLGYSAMNVIISKFPSSREGQRYTHEGYALTFLAGAAALGASTLLLASSLRSSDATRGDRWRDGARGNAGGKSPPQRKDGGRDRALDESTPLMAPSGD